jgi:transposase
MSICRDLGLHPNLATPLALFGEDKRDAVRLARLHRAGELTPVRVPAPAEEAVRDLARVRAAVLADRKRAQQRLTAMLMRHGRIWREGSYWTGAHRAQIAARSFTGPALATTVAFYRAALDARETELACTGVRAGPVVPA